MVLSTGILQLATLFQPVVSTLHSHPHTIYTCTCVQEVYADSLSIDSSLGDLQTRCAALMSQDISSEMVLILERQLLANIFSASSSQEMRSQKVKILRKTQHTCPIGTTANKKRKV